VGIVWQGNKEPDPLRSIPTQELAPLFAVQGIDWVSLQTGPVERELQSLAPQVSQRGASLHSFLETAHAMACLDVVISIDTSSAHLAGALGLPVWTLLPWSADWRWHRDRNDSPYYRSMRLFRQPSQGDWATVLVEVARMLGEKLRPALSRKPWDTGQTSEKASSQIFTLAWQAHRAGKLDEGTKRFRWLMDWCKPIPSSPQAGIAAELSGWGEIVSNPQFKVSNALSRLTPNLATRA